MSAKAKAQLAGQTIGVISGSSGIGLETALPFCLYSPKCVEGVFSEVGGTEDLKRSRWFRASMVGSSGIFGADTDGGGRVAR